MRQCPTCNDSFETRRGLGVHHSVPVRAFLKTPVTADRDYRGHPKGSDPVLWRCVSVPSSESMDIYDNPYEFDAHYLENVVSLCPSCHRRAEFGAISRTRLRATAA